MENPNWIFTSIVSAFPQENALCESARGNGLAAVSALVTLKSLQDAAERGMFSDSLRRIRILPGNRLKRAAFTDSEISFGVWFFSIAPMLSFVGIYAGIPDEALPLHVVVVESEVESKLAEAFLNPSPSVYLIRLHTFRRADEALASIKRGETFGIIEVGRNFSHYRFECRAHSYDTDSSAIAAVDLNIYADSQETRFVLQTLIVDSKRVSIPSFC